jgi:hypothetical protein
MFSFVNNRVGGWRELRTVYVNVPLSLLKSVIRGYRELKEEEHFVGVVF